MIYAIPQRGLGAVSTTAVYTGGATAGVVAGASVAMQTGSILRGSVAGAGATIAALAPLAGPLAPVVAAIGGLVSLTATMFRGCGASCVQTSSAANQASDYAIQIRDKYLAQPVRTKSLQAAAVAGIQDIFSQLRAFCGQAQFGAAGQRCISERLIEGGTAPWCPTGTGCDWVTAILNPVLHDPDVQDDPASAQFTAALGLPSSAAPILGFAGLALVLYGVLS